MNSYKYYQSDFRGSGPKEEKKNDLAVDTNLFFII